MAKTITGIVASKKTDKTIVVAEHVRLTHPLYRKQYTVTKRFMAHDEQNEAQEGDKVMIVECRPLSAHKHFKLRTILQKASVQHIEAENPLKDIVESGDKPKDESATETAVKEIKDE